MTELEFQFQSVVRGRGMDYSQIQEAMRNQFGVELSISEVHQLAEKMESNGVIRREPVFISVD